MNDKEPFSYTTKQYIMKMPIPTYHTGQNELDGRWYAEFADGRRAEGDTEMDAVGNLLIETGQVVPADRSVEVEQ